MLKLTYFLLLISFIKTDVLAQNANLIYSKTVNSTVTIETDIGLGSGFFVTKNIIATNFHVIEGATIAYCYTNNSSTKYKIEGYVAVDKAADLVLLKVAGLNKMPLKMAIKAVVAGQKIFVLGSPKGLPATISDGLVSGLRDFNGLKFIQITAPISPGSSGGPVMNANGELVGISVGQINGGQNLNFAIPKSYLQKLLDSKNNSILLSEQPVTPSSSNQTKNETQDWIKEKIESFSHSYDNLTGYYGTRTFKVAFSNCSMTITWTDDNYNHGSKYFTNKETIIPLKELSKLSFIDVNNEVTSLFFRTKTENLIINTYKGEEPTYKTIHEIRIRKNLLKDNLSERLTKAFDKLIELCGGKITKEVF